MEKLLRQDLGLGNPQKAFILLLYVSRLPASIKRIDSSLLPWSCSSKQILSPFINTTPFSTKYAWIAFLNCLEFMLLLA